jgi:hypothetical protein
LKLLTTVAALLAASSVAAQDKPMASPTDAAIAPAAPAEITPEGAPAPVSVTSAPESSSALYEGNRWGLQLDAGAPSGFSAALVWRPWSFLRLNGGMGYDFAALGVKGGVTLIPFHWGVVPTIGFEGGHFFEGDLSNPPFGSINNASIKVLAKQFSFDYVTADLGLEFGAQNRFVFYVRAGLTQIWWTPQNVQAALDASNAGKYKASQASFTGRGPTGRIGFILYLF